MIDLMCLRQSYERREIMEVKWIDGENNPVDAMTKSKPCRALADVIDNNMINLDATGWVERGEGKTDQKRAEDEDEQGAEDEDKKGAKYKGGKETEREDEGIHWGSAFKDGKETERGDEGIH